MYIIDPNQVSSISVLKPQTLFAMQISGTLHYEMFNSPLKITSIHRIRSAGLHGQGLAFDCRCKDMSKEAAFGNPISPHDTFIRRLAYHLAGLGFDIVHETPEKDDKPEHIHIEYDPK